MILPLAALSVQVAVPMPVLVLGAIGRQELPAHGCAAFLWVAGGAPTVAKTGPAAMAIAEPALLRLSLDGTTVDLPRVSQHGQGGFGLAATTDYRTATLAATLELTIATRADLRDGAAVPQATLRLRRNGEDELVVPLAGLIGCRAAG